MTAAPEHNAVFINVPFDSSYEPLFVTLVGSLVFLGQEPHCVLEVREKGDGRLARIVELMRDCRMSIHDLSRRYASSIQHALRAWLGMFPLFRLVVAAATDIAIARGFISRSHRLT